MGATDSKPESQKKRRRRPSVHSGDLYMAEFGRNSLSKTKTFSPKTQSKSNHTATYDYDFNRSASDLKENLPENLKVYSSSIETIYRFWMYEIETLNEMDSKEASVLLYMNVFRLIPKARMLFTKNIELQSRQFFGMFRWLITNLAQPNAERLIKRLKLLGNAHEKLNIKEEWYGLFLQAFHETMIETSEGAYTPRIRFSMEQLYTVVMNIMVGKDFHSSLSSKKISLLLKSISTLENCLQDNEARKYLEMYMRGQFCVELILFYEEYSMFKATMSQFQRQNIGKIIMDKYIDSSGECEINVSYGTKQCVFQILEENGNMFTSNIFDGCTKEIVELIRMNIWSSFKKSIQDM
eukprot:102704_1